MTPKKLKINPTELTVPKVPIFFIINTIPFHAAAQKFLQKKTYLNISSFRNKLNKSLKAIKQITCATK